MTKGWTRQALLVLKSSRKTLQNQVVGLCKNS